MRPIPSPTLISRVPSIVPVVLLVMVAAAMASCTGRAEEVEQFALERSRAVTFEATDGVQLSGRLFGPDDASAGLVLSHMQPSDQSSWYAFAERMGTAGYRVLTFDFRGYCPGGDSGCSEGQQDVGAMCQDVQGAVGYLRDHGVQRVGLVGASMGGTASLVVAGQPGADIMAIATLSAPASIRGLAVTPEILQQMTAAKLFVAGNGDVNAATDAQMFYTDTLQPKRVEIFPSNDHGTDLLTGNQSENVRTLVSSWLQQFLPVSPPSTGAAP